MTMRVADDDASVAWELLRVVSGLRCELIERDVCRELLMNGVRNTVGYRSAATESHRRPISLTTLTTSTALRSRCWSSLLRSSQRRAGAGWLRNDPMIR
jgi:hypothetical protein